MSKLSKRKSIVLVGNRIDTAYERQKNIVLTAKEVAERTPEEIKNNKQILNNYCERSRVPIELYKHILNIYENKEQLNLF